jgi:hypothetical protein
MDSKFTQFVVFATSIIILILISLFSHNVYYYITGQKPIIVDDTTYLEDTPGIAYNRHKASEQGQHQEKDQGKNKSKEVKTEYTEEKKKSWLSMLYIPSFITTMSSRNVPVTTYKAGANFTSNKPITTLTSTSYEKISSTPSITKTLPNLTYLGTVRTLENINIGDNKIILDNSKIALINGMQLIIDNKNYTITDVSIVTSWFITAIQVLLDIEKIPQLPWDAQNMFGNIVWGEYLLYLLKGSGTHANFFFSTILGLGILSTIWCLLKRKLTVVEYWTYIGSRDQIFFLVYLSMYLACFFIGLSVDYRLVFLLFAFIYFEKTIKLKASIKFLTRSCILITFYSSYNLAFLQPLGDLAQMVFIAILAILMEPYFKLTASRIINKIQVVTTVVLNRTSRD